MNRQVAKHAKKPAYQKYLLIHGQAQHEEKRSGKLKKSNIHAPGQGLGVFLFIICTLICQMVVFPGSKCLL
jgi:hypothetical protein